jgi:hypothetical protein
VHMARQAQAAGIFFSRFNTRHRDESASWAITVRPLRFDGPPRATLFQGPLSTRGERGVRPATMSSWILRACQPATMMHFVLVLCSMELAS